MNNVAISSKDTPTAAQQVFEEPNGVVPGKILRREDCIFWFWTIFFSICWVVVADLFMHNWRLDVIEQAFVGREWVLGSGKHPSLTACIMELGMILTSSAFFTPFLLSRLFILVALYAIWKLACDLLPKPLALAATLSMLNYHFFHYDSVEYNNNITLDAAWAVCVTLCWFAFKTNRMRYWILTGVAIGIGLHFKYTLAQFPMLVVALLLLDPKGRSYWKKPGPWLTTLVAFVIFLPHLIWIVQHDFVTLRYASGQGRMPGWLTHVREPLIFTCGQILFVLPILIPLIPICGWLGRIDRTKWCKTFLQRYLLVIVLAPFLLQLTLAAVKGIHIRAALGSHLWIFLTVFLVYSLKTNEAASRVSCSVRLSVAMHALIILLCFTLIRVEPYIRHRCSRSLFPGRALAAEVERIWHEHSDRPLPWATGEWWLAGNVSAYGKDRARVYCCHGPDTFFTNESFCTWGTMDDVRRDGGIILWTIHSEDKNDLVPPVLSQLFPDASLLTPIVIHVKTSAPVKPVKIGMAIIIRHENGQSTEPEASSIAVPAERLSVNFHTECARPW